MITERVERSLAFHLRKVKAEALMQSRCKTQMSIGVTINQKLIRIRKDLGVTIGCTNENRYRVSRFHKLSTNFDIF